MPQSGQLGFGEANRLILVASVLNLVLPSKMGDLAKAWFMRDRGHLPGSLALSLVVFEKACDLLSLLAWCVFGLAWIKWSDSRALSAFHLPVAWAERLGAAQESLVFWLAGVIVTGSLCAGILLIGSARFAAFFFNIVKTVGGKKAGAKIEKLANGWREMHDRVDDGGRLWRRRRGPDRDVARSRQARTAAVSAAGRSGDSGGAVAVAGRR